MSTARMRRPLSPLLVPVRFLPPRPTKSSTGVLPRLTPLGRPRPSRLEPALDFRSWLRALPWRFFFLAFAVSAATTFCLERYYAHEVRSNVCGEP